MTSRRDHLVDTAYRLFNSNGYHATGIDLILAEAGVSKATLYKHFRSKDELIKEVLRRRGEHFSAWLQEFVDTRVARKYRSDPLGPILAFFDALDTWFRMEDFHGCSFINVSAEFGNPADPIHALAKAAKTRLCDYLEQLLRRCGYSAVRELSRQLLLLADGAMVSAHIQNNTRAAHLAKQAARSLLSGSDVHHSDAVSA